jgi:transcription-repair coupling factor (superfamily II helicase)
LQDRFGPPPPPVANLLKLITLKVEATEKGFESLSVKEGQVVLKARRNMTPNRVALYRRFRNEVKVQLGVIQIPRQLLPADPQELIAALQELVPQISTVGGPQMQTVEASVAQ